MSARASAADTRRSTAGADRACGRAAVLSWKVCGFQAGSDDWPQVALVTLPGPADEWRNVRLAPADVIGRLASRTLPACEFL